MTIKTITIKNIKGFSSKTFDLNIIANKPSLLVAPNGFGKSSLAASFLSLQQNKLGVPEDFLHKNDASLNSKISFEYQDAGNVVHSLQADNSSNTIADHFSWFVINNQIKAKGVGRSFGGRTAVSASIGVKPVTLVETVPKKSDFKYSYRTHKAAFGTNGKVLPNISSFFKNLPFIEKLGEHYPQLDRFNQVRNAKKINAFIEDVNAQTGMTAEELEGWILNNKLDALREIDPLNEVSERLLESNVGLENAAQALSGHASTACYV